MFTKEAFKATTDLVNVWLNGVEVFDVPVSQLDEWVDSGRVDSDNPRNSGHYIVAICGACFGRDGWVSLPGFDSRFVPRVMLTRGYDTLDEAIASVRYHVWYDLDRVLNSSASHNYGYDYEIWHVVVDDPLIDDVDDVADGYVERFSTMQEVVDYVEVALGSFASEFDLWAIAGQVTVYRHGKYCLTADGDDFYRIASEHEI